ncbi:hypothetical protein PUW24_25590 [Paenibacillus urinalis]|uniref:Amidase n=1 Tax=Paenibacillus urinalis TaxID=521520 RepID=A0ABY7XBV1_9BACL|nr:MULTISPECIES: hypothetical protein [Paenibacillus]WDH97458.1 hypothetical protein PUW24_25590 [Paenibacillus urinalis]WDI01125.1 hypothetical protein PUW25_17830 [Paenibacillus urinalis]
MIRGGKAWNAYPAWVKWSLMIVIVVVLLILYFMLKSPVMDEKKATWLWDASLIEQHTEEIVQFLKEQEVDTVFLQTQQEVSDEAYRSFNRSAHAADITVHALNGHADWAYAEKRSEGTAWIEWVKTYNGNAAPEEKFDGVQFDVEPYQLRRWEREEAAVIAEWSENMEEWSREGAEAGLYMSAAVPFWLDSREAPDGSGTFSRWVIDRFDAIAIMAYRDSGEQMYELSKEELAEADELDKKVWIGAELGHTDEGEHLTFFRKPVTNMESEIEIAGKLGTTHRSFAGLAIHHYEAWYQKVTGDLTFAQKNE